MKLDFNNFNKNSKAVFMLLVVLSIFVGISCISASDVANNTVDQNVTPIDINVPDSSNSGIILDSNGCFVMSLRGASGSTGYHWEISPETYGVDLVSHEYVLDHDSHHHSLPGEYQRHDISFIGGAGTDYYTFHVNGDNYYVKLILIAPNGDIVKEVDSDMIN